MFDYYGGKASLARFYQCPRHALIVEPFAGSAMYSMYHLSRNRNLSALLVEKNPSVCKAWEWLRTQTAEGLLKMPIVKAGEKTSDFFIMNSAASTASLNCKQMTVTERMEIRQPSMWRKMARLLWVLPRVEVRCCSYEEIEDLEATWFIDPPYQQNGEALLGNGYAKGCRARDLDFCKLSDWCRTRRGQVIVAEKMGADWMPFRPLRRVTDSQDKHYTEVVWTSEPDEQMEFDFTGEAS